MKGHSTEETKFFKSRSSLKEKENVSKSSMSMSDSMSRRSSIKKTLDEINKFSAKNLLASLSKPTTVANNSLGGHSLGNLKKSNSQIEVNKLEKPCLLKKSNSNMDVSQISKKVNQEDLISSFSLNTTTNKKKKSDEKNKIDNSNKNCSEKIIQDGTLLGIGVSLRVVKENVANFEGELNLEQGDIVELSKVPITKSQLMWEGINRSWGERNGQRGLFPGKCVELEVYDLNPVGTESVYNTNSSLLVESIPSSESLNTIKKPVPLGTQVVVVQDYTKQKADEVDLNIGDVVVVLESPEGGWWRGIKNVGDKNPASGWFPANFVNIVRQPEKKPADQESLKEEESRVNSRKTWYKRLADLTHKSSKKGRKRAESAPSTKTISVIHQNHDSDRPESLLDSVAESNTSINQSKITKSKSSINEFQRRTSSPSISNESLSSILPTTEIVNNIITSRQQSHKRSISAPPGITFDATSHLSTATSSTSSQRHSRQSSRSNSMNNPAPPPTKNTKEADGNDWKKDSLLAAEDEEFRFLLTSEPENSSVNNILPSINLEPPEIGKETLAVNSNNVLPSIILEPPETKKESSVNIEESKPKEDVQSSILTTEIHDDSKSTSREKELELEKKEENLSITPSEDRKKIIRRSLSLNVSPTSGAFEIEGSMPENDIIALNRRSSNLNSTKASSIPLNPENSDKQIILPKRKLTIVSANYSGPDSKGIEKLSTKEQKRQTTILELIQTERDYVRDIKMVVEVFLKPITEKKLLAPKHIDEIFNNLETILLMNKEFLKTLEDRLSESPVISNIGELFLKAADKFIPYTIYCSHQAYSISKLQSFTKNKSDFRLFLEESYKGQQTRGLDLGSYLIKPVQRLCKYPLLLKEILKSTEETATDYPDLKLALEKVQAIVNLVNESARQSEGNGMKKIIDIQNSFTEKVNFVTSSRCLVREDIFFLQIGESKKPRKLFLFNDLIIVARKDWRDKLHLIEKATFRQCGISDVQEDSFEGHVSKHLFEIEIGEEKDASERTRYLFSCGSKALKQLWLDSYKNLSQLAVESKHLKDMKTESNYNSDSDDEEEVKKKRKADKLEIKNLREKLEKAEQKIANITKDLNLVQKAKSEQQIQIIKSDETILSNLATINKLEISQKEALLKIAELSTENQSLVEKARGFAADVNRLNNIITSNANKEKKNDAEKKAQIEVLDNTVANCNLETKKLKLEAIENQKKYDTLLNELENQKKLDLKSLEEKQAFTNKILELECQINSKNSEVSNLKANFQENLKLVTEKLCKSTKSLEEAESQQFKLTQAADILKKTIFKAQTQLQENESVIARLNENLSNAKLVAEKSDAIIQQKNVELKKLEFELAKNETNNLNLNELKSFFEKTVQLNQEKEKNNSQDLKIVELKEKILKDSTDFDKFKQEFEISEKLKIAGLKKEFSEELQTVKNQLQDSSEKFKEKLHEVEMQNQKLKSDLGRSDEILIEKENKIKDLEKQIEKLSRSFEDLKQKSMHIHEKQKLAIQVLNQKLEEERREKDTVTASLQKSHLIAVSEKDKNKVELERLKEEKEQLQNHYEMLKEELQSVKSFKDNEIQNLFKVITDFKDQFKCMEDSKAELTASKDLQNKTIAELNEKIKLNEILNKEKAERILILENELSKTSGTLESNKAFKELLEKTIQEKNDTLKEKERQCNELLQKLSAATESLVLKSEDAVKVKHSLNEKSKEFSDLKILFDNQEAVIKGIISELQGDKQELYRLSTLEKVLQEKNEEVVESSKKLKNAELGFKETEGEFRQEVKRLRAELKIVEECYDEYKKKVEAEKKNIVVAQQSKKTIELAATILEKDADIADLSKTVKEKNDIIKNNEAEIEKLKTQSNQTSSKLTTVISILQSNFKTLEDVNVNKDLKLSRLESELEKTTKQMNDDKSLLEKKVDLCNSESEKIIMNLKEIILKTTTEVEKANNEVEFQKRKCLDYCEKIKKFEKELNKKHNLITNQDESIKSLKNSIASMELFLKEKETKISEKIRENEVLVRDLHIAKNQLTEAEKSHSNLTIKFDDYKLIAGESQSKFEIMISKLKNVIKQKDEIISSTTKKTEELIKENEKKLSEQFELLHNEASQNKVEAKVLCDKLMEKEIKLVRVEIENEYLMKENSKGTNALNDFTQTANKKIDCDNMKLKESEIEIKNLQALVLELKENMQRVEKSSLEIERLNTKLTNLEIENKNLEMLSTEKQQNNNQLLQQLEEKDATLLTKLNEKNSEIETLKEKYQQTIDEVSHKLFESQKSLTDINHKLDLERDATKERNDVIFTKDKEIYKLRKELEAYENNVQEMVKSLEQKKSLIILLKREKEEIIISLQKLKVEFQGLETEKDLLFADNVKLKNQKQKFKEFLTQSAEENSNVLAEKKGIIKKLKRDIAQCSDSNIRATEALKLRDQKIVDLNQRLGLKTHELTKYVEKIGSLQIELDGLRVLKLESQQQMNKITEMSGKLEVLKEKLSSSNKQISELKLVLKKLEVEEKKATDSNFDLQLKLACLENEAGNLCSKLKESSLLEHQSTATKKELESLIFAKNTLNENFLNVSVLCEKRLKIISNLVKMINEISNLVLKRSLLDSENLAGQELSTDNEFILFLDLKEKLNNLLSDKKKLEHELDVQKSNFLELTYLSKVDLENIELLTSKIERSESNSNEKLKIKFAEVLKLKKELQLANNCLQTFKTENENFRKDLVDINKKIKYLNLEKIKVENDCFAMSEENKNLMKNLAHCKRELEVANSKIDGNLKLVNKLENNLSRCNSEKEKFKLEKEELVENLNVQRSMKNSLNAKISHLEENNQLLHSKFTIFKNGIPEIKKTFETAIDVKVKQHLEKQNEVKLKLPKALEEFKYSFNQINTVVRNNIENCCLLVETAIKNMQSLKKPTLISKDLEFFVKKPENFKAEDLAEEMVLVLNDIQTELGLIFINYKNFYDTAIENSIQVEKVFLN